MLLARLVSGRYGPPTEDRPYTNSSAAAARISWFSWFLALFGRKA